MRQLQFERTRFLALLSQPGCLCRRLGPRRGNRHSPPYHKPSNLARGQRTTQVCFVVFFLWFKPRVVSVCISLDFWLSWGVEVAKPLPPWSQLHPPMKGLFTKHRITSPTNFASPTKPRPPTGLTFLLRPSRTRLSCLVDAGFSNVTVEIVDRGVLQN